MGQTAMNMPHQAAAEVDDLFRQAAHRHDLRGQDIQGNTQIGKVVNGRKQFLRDDQHTAVQNSNGHDGDDSHREAHGKSNNDDDQKSNQQTKSHSTTPP